MDTAPAAPAPDLSVLDGAYLRDLLAQPEAVAATLAGLDALAAPPPRALAARRLVLTGMGSSLHAQHPLHHRLLRSGRTVFLVETAELLHAQSALLTSDTVVVAVSQSGRSAETVQLLDTLASRVARPFIVGVTNTPDSPLARRADFVVPLHAGAEFSVSCKTYLASLLALAWLGAALCGEEPGATSDTLAPAAALTKGYLDRWETHVRQLAPELRGLRHLFLTGRGDSLAAVATGALILKESTRTHAEGMSSPSFRHGPLELAGPGFFAVVFAGDPETASLNATLAADIRAAGGRAALVSAAASPDATVPASSPFVLPATSAALRPLLEMLPVQMISLALAALAGREPGRFTHATKVTTIA